MRTPTPHVQSHKHKTALWVFSFSFSPFSPSIHFSTKSFGLEILSILPCPAGCQVQQLSLIVGLECCCGLCKQDQEPRATRTASHYTDAGQVQLSRLARQDTTNTRTAHTLTTHTARGEKHVDGFFVRKNSMMVDPIKARGDYWMVCGDGALPCIKISCTF